MQWLLIALIVTSAALYVVWSLASLRLRQAMLDTLARAGLFREAAERHRDSMTSGGCSNCGQARAPRSALK